MNKKNIIILVIAIIILILAIGVYIYAKSIKTPNNDVTNSISKISNEEENKEFYFYDEDGNRLNLSNFSDKPIIMLFWKSDDAKSYDVINLLEQYNSEYKDNIYFFAVNVNEANLDLEIVKNVKAAQFKIPMYFDTDLTSTNEFNYSSLPNLVFINQGGEVENQLSGVITEDNLISNIDLLLNNF